MDRTCIRCIYRTCLINWITQYIHNTTQSFTANRNSNRSPSIIHSHTTL